MGAAQRARSRAVHLITPGLASAQRRLAVGVVGVEFGAAVTRFVATTLLPVIATDLGARRHLGLLLAGGTIGLFAALPVAASLAARLGTARALTVGLAGYLAGTAVAVTATTAWTFAAGQLVSGFASGLLAVFGVSAVVRELDATMRAWVVAASSAMWIVPSLVGPAATLGVEHLIGWRVALLLPVPFVLGGRVLVGAVARAPGSVARDRPVARTLLVPAGAALAIAAGSSPLAVVGLALTVAGVGGLLPSGTMRLRRGVPSAVAGLTLFAIGWFGADSLITVLLTAGDGLALSRAAVVLSAGALGWALTSLVLMRARSTFAPAVPVGLLVAALGAAVLGSGVGGFVVALVAWGLGGVGIGLAYPGLYVRATTTDDAADASVLATAVITAEAFGGLFGQVTGGALFAASGVTGLRVGYAFFCVALVTAAVAAARAGTRDSASHPT